MIRKFEHAFGPVVTERFVRPFGGPLLTRRGIKRDRESEPTPAPKMAKYAARRGYRSRTSTRSARRRSRRGGRRRFVPRALVPRYTMRRLKAVLTETLTTTAGALKTQLVSINDLTDPFQGVASSAQPLGYDQWKLLYNKGVVVGSKIIIRIHNGGAASVLCGITPVPESQGSTALTEVEHYMEMPSTKTKLLSPDMDHCTMFHKLGVAKFFGVRNLADEDKFHVDLDGETSPTRTGWWNFWVRPIDRTTACAIDIAITVEYLVKLYDPIVPARSFDS